MGLYIQRLCGCYTTKNRLFVAARGCVHTRRHCHHINFDVNCLRTDLFTFLRVPRRWIYFQLFVSSLIFTDIPRFDWRGKEIKFFFFFFLLPLGAGGVPLLRGITLRGSTFSSSSAAGGVGILTGNHHKLPRNRPTHAASKTTRRRLTPFFAHRYFFSSHESFGPRIAMATRTKVLHPQQDVQGNETRKRSLTDRVAVELGGLVVAFIRIRRGEGMRHRSQEFPIGRNKHKTTKRNPKRYTRHGSV